jgi:uncharacterized protein YdeI (YjbR/CyaY-like superfamily)
MTAVYFPDSKAFRSWLEGHHQDTDELWVGYHKKATGKPSMTWPESVDQALCFGWIDGIRKSVDEERYMIRFTPRRPNSHWSRVNLDKYEILLQDGLVEPEGIAAFERRKSDRTAQYSYEREEPALTPDQLTIFQQNPAAWVFFQAEPAGYRRTAVAWVNSAKREETRSRRLTTLITDSAQGLRIKQMRR